MSDSLRVSLGQRLQSGAGLHSTLCVVWFSIWWSQQPACAPTYRIQSMSLYSWCYTRLLQRQWWMANAGSYRWLFTEVFHTVTLTPRRVTPERFEFIHVSPFQRVTKPVRATDFTVISFSSLFFFFFCCVSPVHVCVGDRCPPPHLSCLTLEQTWKSKRACQRDAAHSCCRLFMWGRHLLWLCTAAVSL